MTFVGILSRIKLLFGPLVIQLVWYILKQLFTLVSVKVADIVNYSLQQPNCISIKLTNLAGFAFPAFKAVTFNTFIYICSAVTIVITGVGLGSARCKFWKQNDNNARFSFERGKQLEFALHYHTQIRSKIKTSCGSETFFPQYMEAAYFHFQFSMIQIGFCWFFNTELKTRQQIPWSNSLG